jgi:hypothetical protein
MLSLRYSPAICYLLSAIDRSAVHAHTFPWNMFPCLLARTEHVTISSAALYVVV